MVLYATTQPIGSVICFSYAVLYVFVLYFPSTDVNLVQRNTPIMIKRRIKAVLYLCIICGFSTVWLTRPSYIKHFPHAFFILGIWPCKGRDVLRSLTLVFCLFLGPFVKRIGLTRRLPRSFSSRISLTHADRNTRRWIRWRNYVVGPFTEEFVFRSCMIPLLRQMSTSNTIIVASLLFGIAHIHHFYEYSRSYPGYIKTGLLTYLFQFFYTTIFGGFTSYLYLYNQNLWSIVAVHIFCNWIEFPQLYGLVDNSKFKTVIYYIMLWLGFIGFIIFFKPLTQPF
ncbi:CAAX prenyl protease [Pneumocystis jirovecii RU7]|uniref:intramembrane prenyl-peptidase Rce1 n=1 Tax=Pneumocystis jirovecii (strain RU7) TaxID=1408657 RepID=A0A0W4ZKV6_PNEJ7|nr:CAAX prenyl protease [Pneumocystis jirovecii RU7]KTW29010.1 hypothetical protein T551_02284 [Pneumocystis jirovecii RU7]